jgi:hypothetical protein
MLPARSGPRDDWVRGAQAAHVAFCLRIGLGCCQAPRADVFPISAVVTAIRIVTAKPP